MFWVSTGSAPHRRYCKLQRNGASHGWLLHTQRAIGQQQRAGRIIFSPYPYAFLARAHRGFADKTQLCHICQTWGCHGNITDGTTFNKPLSQGQSVQGKSCCSCSEVKQLSRSQHHPTATSVLNCFVLWTPCVHDSEKIFYRIPHLQWWVSLLLKNIISKSHYNQCWNDNLIQQPVFWLCSSSTHLAEKPPLIQKNNCFNKVLSTTSAGFFFSCPVPLAIS